MRRAMRRGGECGGLYKAHVCDQAARIRKATRVTAQRTNSESVVGPSGAPVFVEFR